MAEIILSEQNQTGSLGSFQNQQVPQNPMRILRLPEVVERVGLKRASIYQHMGQGTFPKQIALGERAVGWIESEIEAWLTAKVLARKTSNPTQTESTGFQKGVEPQG